MRNFFLQKLKAEKTAFLLKKFFLLNFQKNLEAKILNNVHVGDGDFSQVEKIQHAGMMVIGTYDNFTCGNPVDFLENINKFLLTKSVFFL